jgi:hypothetical protein
MSNLIELENTKTVIHIRRFTDKSGKEVTVRLEDDIPVWIATPDLSIDLTNKSVILILYVLKQMSLEDEQRKRS